MIRRQAKPMWIQMCANKSILTHCVFQVTQPLHAAKRIHTGKPGEALWISRADLSNALIWDLERAAHIQVATAHGDQQGPLNAGAIHLRQIVLDGNTAALLLRHADLRFEHVVDASLAVPHLLRREEIADDVNCTDHPEPVPKIIARPYERGCALSSCFSYCGICVLIIPQYGITLVARRCAATTCTHGLCHARR